MNKKQQSIRNPFPRKIGRYFFVKKLDLSNTSSFVFAEYRDIQGNEYVCKLWNGRKLGVKHGFIKNEIASYKLLKELNSKKTTRKMDFHEKINFPNMVFSRETSNKIFFIVEKVKGDFLETKSDIFKSKKYYEIYQYFNYISTNLNLSDMNIAKRSFKNYFILYHIYLLLIALKKPNLIINLLKSVPGVYLGFSKLLFSNDLMLVMRDIGSEGNIFIDSNKATLIDLENLTITNKYAFFTSIILANSNNSNFLNLFLGTKNMEKLIKSKTELDIFKSLLLYSIVVQFLDDIENGIKNAESTHNLYDSVLGLDTSNYFLKEINKKYENRKTEKELISNKLTAQYVQ